MNPVYGAVESKAHGLVPLILNDWFIVAPITVAAGMLHLLAGGAAAVVMVAVVLGLRHHFDDRRNWLAIWRRRRDPPTYSILERDKSYRPYGPRTSP